MRASAINSLSPGRTPAFLNAVKTLSRIRFWSRQQAKNTHADMKKALHGAVWVEKTVGIAKIFADSFRGFDDRPDTT